MFFLQPEVCPWSPLCVPNKPRQPSRHLTRALPGWQAGAPPCLSALGDDLLVDRGMCPIVTTRLAVLALPCQKLRDKTRSETGVPLTPEIQNRKKKGSSLVSFPSSQKKMTVGAVPGVVTGTCPTLATSQECVTSAPGASTPGQKPKE